MLEKQNEKLLHREENEYLKISEDGTEASGIYFPNAALTFRDGDSSVISYSDTGFLYCLEEATSIRKI